MLYEVITNISSLNTAWGTSITSWTTLTNSYTGTIGDQGELLYQVADKYYSTVDAALAAKLPKKLYMGSRFAEWGVNNEVIDACGKYADVVSFNCYKNNRITSYNVCYTKLLRIFHKHQLLRC